MAKPISNSPCLFTKLILLLFHLSYAPPSDMFFPQRLCGSLLDDGRIFDGFGFIV